MDKQKVIDFLKDLAGTGGVEINKNANTLLKFNDAWGQQQIYFCAGCKKGLKKRCGDADFEKKKYIPVDIDIRLDYYKRTGKILSHEEMMDIINDILKKIDNTTELYSYSYAVCSGNGLHLYYVGDEIEFPNYQTYAKGVEYIQGILNDIIVPYQCDPAVKNIARIMRLPGTINPRKKMEGGKVLRDMGDYICEFLKYKPGTYSNIIGSLPSLAEELDKGNEVKTQIKTHKEKSRHPEFNSVDVGELACIAWNVKLGDRNGDVTPLKEPHKNMGAYVYNPYNVVINTGSSLIRERSQHMFTPWDIVYYEMMGENEEKTIAYFESNYHIKARKYKKEGPKEIVVPEFNYDETKGFLYPAPVFDSQFRCFMAGELVTVCAEPNSGKTTFALDIITRNKKEKNRKGFYINLEFNIKNVRRQRWLSRHGFDKLNLTDLSPLSPEDRAKMDMFVDSELAKFDYINEPTGMELEEVADILINRAKDGYELAVIDTLGDIHGNSGANSWSTQNHTMQVLQSIAQRTGLAIVLLHHMNRKGSYSGSAKIKDYSNVFIEVSTAVDGNMEKYTEYEMTKDKFLGNDKVVDCYYDGGAYRKF